MATYSQRTAQYYDQLCDAQERGSHHTRAMASRSRYNRCHLQMDATRRHLVTNSIEMRLGNSLVDIEVIAWGHESSLHNREYKDCKILNPGESIREHLPIVASPEASSGEGVGGRNKCIGSSQLWPPLRQAQGKAWARGISASVAANCGLP